MTTKEYRVEVLYPNKSLTDVWIPIGYDDIFRSYEDAEDDMKYRQSHNPTRKYRIVEREVSEWKEANQ